MSLQNGDILDIVLPTGGSNPKATALRPGSDLVLEGIDFHHVIPQYQCFALGWLLQADGDNASMEIINKMYSGTAGNPTEPYVRDRSDAAVQACAQRFRGALAFGFYGPTNRTDNPEQNPEPVRPDTFSDFRWQIIQRTGLKLRQMCPQLRAATRGQTVRLTVQEKLLGEIKDDLRKLLSNAGTSKHSGYVHPFWPNDWVVDGGDGRTSYLLYFRPISGRTKTAYPYVQGLAEALAHPGDNEDWVNTAFKSLIDRVGGNVQTANRIVNDARTTPPLSFKVRHSGDAMNFFWNRYVTPENDGKGQQLLKGTVVPCVPFKKADRPQFYAVR